MKKFESFLIEGQIDPLTYHLPKLYKELNAMLFGNELPQDIPVSFKKLPKRIAGICHASKVTSYGRSTLVPGTIKIEIDPRQYPEDALKGILAHEMIHAWLYLRNDFKTNHDGLFLIKLYEIRKKANFSISIDHTTSAEELDGVEDKTTVALIAQYPDGRISVGIYALNSLQSGLNDAKRFADGNVKGQISPHLTRVRYGTLTSKLHNMMPVQRVFNVNKIKMYPVKDLRHIEKFKSILDVKDGQ